MRPLRLGPVELLTAELDGDKPSAAFFDALLRLLASGGLRLLDLAVVRRGIDGEISIHEVAGDELDHVGVGLHTPGLAVEDDIRAACTSLAPERAAAILVFDLAWARTLTDEFASVGVRIVAAERMPAIVANAVLDCALDQE